MITKEEFDAAKMEGRPIYVLRHEIDICEEHLSRNAEWENANAGTPLNYIRLGRFEDAAFNCFLDESSAVHQAICRVDNTIQYHQSCRAELVARSDRLNKVKEPNHE